MMDKKMQALVNAPLADPFKLYLPEGKRPAVRAKKADYGDDIGCPKLSHKELRERKEKTLSAKLAKLLDYYAGTATPAERVAEHLALYRQERDGVDEAGKPKFKRVLDVQRVEHELAWRRRKAA